MTVMQHLTDADLNDEIREIRDHLASVIPAGDCLGRRVARARLGALEDEMVRRYEIEMWGTER